MMRRAILLACVALMLVIEMALAGGGPEIRYFVIGSGGGVVGSGDYRMHATVGQAVAGPAGDLALANTVCAGFWCSAQQWRLTAVYLPLILK